jgi:hypothetical protein
LLGPWGRDAMYIETKRIGLFLVLEILGQE